MKKLLAALFLLIGVVGLSHAGVYISTTVSADRSSASIYTNAGERLTYRLTNAFTGTAVLEKSKDGYNWYSTGVSSTNNAAAGNLTGSINVSNAEFYRWRGTTITAGAFKFELITGIAKSTATTEGNSDGNYFEAYLAGTVAASEGSVLVATHPVAGFGVTVMVSRAALDQTSWIGVAKHDASTGSIVDVYYSGFVLALTTGTVTAGDTLVTTNTATGYLGIDTTPTTGADVGVALSGGNAAGGRTKIRLQ